MDTVISESVGFNPAPPSFMHIDLNSCFASCEQQANPKLRGKPVAVAAYATGNGCILAASTEAKRSGVKTGMRVREGKLLCPGLIILSPDPNKYRYVNRKLLLLLQRYTADVEVKSIDEMVLDMKHAPGMEKFRGVQAFSGRTGKGSFASPVSGKMLSVAKEIKTKIREEIGDYLTVSIGISTNRYLSKVGSGLHKPDGLDVITGGNAEQVFEGMNLEDLCGIKEGYGGRLRNAGISSAVSFYRAPIVLLKHAFRSVVGYHWWLRLHGWEADDRQFARKSFGNSHALYVPYRVSDPRLLQVLAQLTEKTGKRLRAHGFSARGIHVSALFEDGTFAHRGRLMPHVLYATPDIYSAACATLSRFPDKGVRILAIACFELEEAGTYQLELFRSDGRKRRLAKAMDTINDRWGDFTIGMGRMLSAERRVLDRIAFGGVRELEEFAFREDAEH